MDERRGIRSVMEQAESAGVDLNDNHDVVYQATLATLLRVKQKVRVPPRLGEPPKMFDYHKMEESRYPQHGKKLDPDNPPAYPYDCEPECETCFTQTFPARVGVTDETARERVSTLTTAINDDLEAVRAYLLSDADYIVNRWRKSKAKRSELLNSICSDSKGSPSHEKKWAVVHLVHSHNRDEMQSMFEASKNEPDTWLSRFRFHAANYATREVLEDQKGRYQTTWLRPYLDQESLIEEPLLFLGLLHARTAYSPEEWMMFDNAQLKVAEAFEVLVSEYNPHYVLMTGAHYGKHLVKWDKERCHHWEMVGYQKAMHILTTQRHMMRFLRSMVEALLQNRTLNAKQPESPRPKWDLLVRNGFFSFGDSSAVAIRASAKQPFCAPPTFDPKKTVELVQSMYEACIDEFDLAQTDSAYLQFLIRRLEASAYTKSMDVEGRWQFIIDELVCNFYRRLIWWRQMHKECQIMLEKYEEFLATPNLQTRKAYEASLYIIMDVATEHLTQQILLVQYSMPFQPGFVRNFEYERTAGPDQPMTISDSDAFNKDKLFWSIRGLGFDRDRLFTMDPSFQLRVLDDELSHATSKERGRINDQLLQNISELAVVEEIRTSIACDRGWDREPEDLSEQMDVAFRKDFIAKYAQSLSLPDLIRSGTLAKLLQTFKQNSPWPTGKRDEAWLKAAAASRANLNKFWTGFRIGLKSQQLRKQFPPSFIDEDQAVLSAAARSSHVRTVEDEEQRILDTLKPRTPLKSPAPPAKWPLEEPAKFVAPAPKLRKKTRPSASTETEPEESRATADTTCVDPSTNSESQPAYDVKPENLALFQAMFSTPKSQMRSYSWDHFTKAMVDAGCSIVQGSGSTVHFKSTEGNMVFHRPHPDPTIAQEIFIAMGKRLTKRFGWIEGTFRCAGVSE